MHLPEWPHWNWSAVQTSPPELPLLLPLGGNRMPGQVGNLEIQFRSIKSDCQLLYVPCSFMVFYGFFFLM
jgi:hypothetical protein